MKSGDSGTLLDREICLIRFFCVEGVQICNIELNFDVMPFIFADVLILLQNRIINLKKQILYLNNHLLYDMINKVSFVLY